MENGKELSRTCALCHGKFMQGVAGDIYPRLAGLPSGYTENELQRLKDGRRKAHLPMLITSMVDTMSAADMEDVSVYLEHMTIPTAHVRAIPRPTYGNSAAGKNIYLEEECDGCHKKDGSGKAKKGIPPLKGQHTDYMLKQFEDFKNIARIHDGEDEKDDSSFVDMNPDILRDLVAYISTFDD
jgi:cytochrome c553